MVIVMALSGPAPLEPTLWLHPQGRLLVEGKPVKARLAPGARTLPTPFGLGLDLNGIHGGLLVPDLPALALTRSITVSTWVFLRSYVNDGPGAQIFFRGDDRSGYDPYYLAILGDGTAQFCINDDEGRSAYALAEVPLNRWVRLTGTFDAEVGEVRMWLDDRLVANRQTSRRPFAPLDGGWSPGIGIGNVQNDHGPHNQPVNGMIADLRVYASALEPSQAGWRPFRAG